MACAKGDVQRMLHVSGEIIVICVRLDGARLWIKPFVVVK